LSTLHQSRFSRRGFTLVEILVVVAIIGMAGAIVVPVISQPSSFSIQAASRMLISDILIAQNDAIASQQNRRLVFNQVLNTYSLTDTAGNVLSASIRAGSTSGNYVVDFNTDRRFAGVALQNVNFGGNPFLEFDPLGAPMNGGTLQLTAPNANNNLFTITVAAFTGRVSIQ